jgi:hypothetical protein
MERKEWKSQRQIKAEMTAYLGQRFEIYMLQVDKGEMDLETACAVLREEVSYQEDSNGSEVTK